MIKKIGHLFKNAFLGGHFFIYLGSILLLFIIGNFYASIFTLAKIVLLMFSFLFIYDVFQVFNIINKVSLNRKVPETIYLFNSFKVDVSIRNTSNKSIFAILIEDVPHQFQWRENSINLNKISPYETIKVNYHLIPKTRGLYKFGNANLFISSSLRLFKFRKVFELPYTLKCLPSVPDMLLLEKQFFNYKPNLEGVKKTRKIGHSYEFDRIKKYNQGDDIRAINWKATGKKNMLMVNQFQDLKSQQVYSIIDKGRLMSVAFNNFGLLEYAINATLAISNVVLKKEDKAGLITFSDKIGTTLKASNKPFQIHKILRCLYKEKERIDKDSDFDLLYRGVKNIVKGRSLVFLYTNFENEDTLKKQLIYLKKIKQLHLLVVVIFENIELINFANSRAADEVEVFQKTAATYAINQKQNIANILNQFGIETIICQPSNLSISIANKYNQLKSKGII